MLEQEKRVRLQKIEHLDKYIRSISPQKIGQMQLEDVSRAARLSKVAKPQKIGHLFIVFDTYTDNAPSTYNTYKVIDPVVWYFHLGLNDQPKATIDFLYEMFFGVLVKLPDRKEIDFLK